MTEADRMEALAQEVARLRARAEIEEQMARLQQLLSSGRSAEIPDALFARSTADVSLEFGASGQYIGLKKLATFFEKDVVPGQFQIAALASPSITVAPDGRCAHGCWTVIGMELDAGDLGAAPPSDAQERALLTSRTQDGQAYRAEWVWQRWQAEFVCEEVWRLRQLRILDLLRSPMGGDFVRFATERWATDGIRLDRLFTSNIPFAPGELPENLANAPTSWHWQYRTDALPPEDF